MLSFQAHILSHRSGKTKTKQRKSNQAHLNALQIIRFKLRNSKPELNILNFTKQAVDSKWVTTKSKIYTHKKKGTMQSTLAQITACTAYCVVHFQLHFELLHCNSYISASTHRLKRLSLQKQQI